MLQFALFYLGSHIYMMWYEQNYCLIVIYMSRHLRGLINILYDKENYTSYNLYFGIINTDICP